MGTAAMVTSLSKPALQRRFRPGRSRSPRVDAVQVFHADFPRGDLAQCDHRGLVARGLDVRGAALGELAGAVGGRERQLETVGDSFQTIFDGDARHGASISLAKCFENFRVVCALAGERQPGRLHDGGKVPPGFFELFVNNNIIELSDVAYFLARVVQSPLDRLLGVLASRPQPALELGQHRDRRKDEDAHRVGKGLADLPGALPVDFEHDVQSLRARFADPLARSAVAVSVHLRRFEELAAPEHLLEGLAVDEMVLAPVHLARARRPRGEGDREREPLVLGEHRAHQGRFARAGGRRDDEEVAGHSMFCICSRICSISSLNSRLASDRSFETDFEPSVLASRLSSCIRKSRRLPTVPPPLTTRCTSSRCAPRRFSSSATSALTPKSAIASGSLGWIETSSDLRRSARSRSILPSFSPSRERVAANSSRSSRTSATQASRTSAERSSPSTPGQCSASPTHSGCASGIAVRTLRETSASAASSASFTLICGAAPAGGVTETRHSTLPRPTRAWISSRSIGSTARSSSGSRNWTSRKRPLTLFSSAASEATGKSRVAAAYPVMLQIIDRDL